MPYKDPIVDKEHHKQKYLENKNDLNSSAHPIYRSWLKAKRKNLLCEEWQEYNTFKEWALTNGWEQNLKLTRKDLNLSFSPINCYYTDKVIGYKKEYARERDPLYKCWTTLKHRKKDYFCKEWLEFNNFKNWAINQNWQEGISILCTHDENEKYSPNNCYYITKQKENLEEKIINYKNEQITIKELSKKSECEVNYATLVRRIINNNIDPEKAIFKSYSPKNWTRVNELITIFGETKTTREWTKDPRCKVSYRKFSTRYFLWGINPEIALQSTEHLSYRKSQCKLTNEEINEKCNEFLHGNFTIINKFGNFSGIKGIYAIFNTVSGKLYIGQANNKVGLNHRLARHQRELERNKHPNPHLQNSWNKRGESTFAFIFLENLTNELDDKITEREDYWIKYYNTKNNKFGYNINDAVGGARLGIFTSPYTIPQIKEWIEKYIIEFNKIPNTNSGIIPHDPLNRTWNAVNSALWIGNGGLPGKITLKQLVCEVQNIPYTKGSI